MRQVLWTYTIVRLWLDEYSKREKEHLWGAALVVIKARQARKMNIALKEEEKERTEFINAIKSNV